MAEGIVARGDASHAAFDDVVEEVERRHPGYFAAHQVFFPNAVDLVLNDDIIPAHVDIPAQLAHAAGRYRAIGVRLQENPNQSDPIGLMLAYAALDSLNARGPQAFYKTVNEPAFTIAFQSRYQAVSCGASGHVWHRRTAGVPLLLLNARGVPLSTWERLLFDSCLPFQVFVSETAGVDLLQGTLASASSIKADVESIAKNLLSLGLRKMTVLAWSSAGKVAVDLAARFPDLVQSVLLVSPNFHYPGDSSEGRSFSSQLRGLFEDLKAAPQLAGTIAGLIQKQIEHDRLLDPRGGSPKNSAALLRLPAAIHAETLVKPLIDMNSILHYATRSILDDAYPLTPALKLLKRPTLLVGGAQDHVIDNALSHDLLKNSGDFLGSILIEGTGHYLHDLQYNHLRHILQRFMCNEALPASTLRIKTKPSSRAAHATT